MMAGSGDVPGVPRAAVRCCGVELTNLVAEAKSARSLLDAGRNIHVNRGLTVRIWWCPFCERETTEGWVPPTFISAVARKAAEIRDEMEAALGETARARLDRGGFIFLDDVDTRS